MIRIGSSNFSSIHFYQTIVLAIAMLACQPAVANEVKNLSVESKKEYSMGVFPFLPPRQLEKVFAPLAKDLGDAINRKIVLKTNTTYAKFAENLDAEKFDIAFVQPFDYIRIADNLGYRPLVTRKNSLKSVLVVKPDSPVKSLADMKDKHVAFPPPVAAVSRLMKAHFATNGLIPGKDVKYSHHRSHVSCMQQVLIGEADACGTALPAIRFFEYKMKAKLTIITKSQAIPHSLFAAHPKVPEFEREILRQRIINWPKTETGRKLMNIGKLKSFKRIKDSDYNIVREFDKKSR